MEIVNNQELTNKMIESGKEYVQRFSEDAIAAEIMDIYGCLRAASSGKSGSSEVVIPVE
jgi:glycosyltransferase involved in cell wall biosynthesis